MKIKKYVAKSMPEALQLVRDELGEAAVIINTRQLRRNSRFNHNDEACVEVTAAMDEAISQVPPGVETSEHYAGATAPRGLAGAAAARRYAAQAVGESAPASRPPQATTSELRNAPSAGGFAQPVEALGGDLARTIDFLKKAADC